MPTIRFNDESGGCTAAVRVTPLSTTWLCLIAKGSGRHSAGAVGAG